MMANGGAEYILDHFVILLNYTVFLLLVYSAVATIIISEKSIKPCYGLEKRGILLDMCSTSDQRLDSNGRS